MPFEIVQRPGGGLTNPTEISVHWTKESHVQLRVDRDHLMKCANGCDDIIVPTPLAMAGETFVRGRAGCSDCPPPNARELPVGTVRVGDSQVAYKTHESEHPTDVSWTILRLCGSLEYATDEQVQNLVVVAMPEDGAAVPAAQIWTEVLNRGALNRMIKVLRKARDDAYGADA